MSLMIRKLVKNQYNLCKNVYTPLATSYRTNYYILLPEVPSDTPQTNAFMRNENIPPFNEIDPKQVISGFQKLIVNYETQVNELLEKNDSDKEYDKSFEGIFHPIEKSFAPLDYAYKTSRHLGFIYPFTKFHMGFTRVNNKYSRVKSNRWSNPKLFKILQEIQSNKHLLSESQSRYVDRVMKVCTLNGLHLNEAESRICRELNNTIEDQQELFRDTLTKANQKFGLRISDQTPMEEIPTELKRMMATDPSNPNKGPWTIIADDRIFTGLMKHSSNRKIRKTLYESYYSRGATSTTKLIGTSNTEVIKDLVKYRKKQAEFFGYKNFAEMKIENTSADCLENVIDMFEKIKTNVRPVVDEDFKNLESFANKNGNGQALEGYDIDYWIQKHTSQNYFVDQSKLTEYFPYKKVMNGMFDIAKLLFNVEFKQDNSQASKLWHPTVEVYNVHDENGQHVSTLVIDPFLRSKKINSIWSYSGRDSSRIANEKPLAYLNLNVLDRGSSTTMTFDQVKSLFNEFGSLIQILLSSTDFAEFSDINTGEVDALDLPNKLFNKFLYVPEIINMVSAHQNTGEPLPIEIVDKLKNSQTNFQSFALMKQTFLSAFDIESHITDKFWLNVMTELWPKFLPVKLNKLDQRPCQFVNIFGQNFGCNYYSVIWADMLAADLYEAFNDTGFSNKTKIQDVGRRYRDTFLKNGSSLPFNEMFRQFRGRNPSMDPFIKSYLKTNKN